MIRSAFSMIFFCVSILFFALLSMLLSVLPGLGPSSWGLRSFGKVALWVAGIRLEVIGLENLNPKKPAIYMANHSTILDIAILLAALPVDLRFMFKQSLAYIPIVGWSMLSTGMIPVKRGAKGPALKSLRKAAKRIKNGVHVIIFPEGTRTKTGELGELKKGGFLLASLAEVDIIPVHISDTDHVCGRNIPFTKPGTLQITIHPVIPHSKESKAARRQMIQTVQAQIGNPVRS